ncbi:response regulator [Edaphobacter modestus]|uniref:Response regulator receiver domain-containing protein n=1 Tax=Edaphobacter modestus TaxID=388466 RepID=A0A4Q7YRR0_9BACT|nr:response regulator [Edaphobacter modestus]RZU39603.1 response regulator receiver domain-containing protein [Edaphobacter modestus]
MHLDSLSSKKRSAKILVVDDDPDIRSLIRTFLEHEGHTVHVSGDADRAAKLFSRSPGIDLVITDYSMPQRSGFDLARELKSIRPSLRVLIMSGVIVSSGQLDQMKTHGWKFLPKPFSLPKLLAEVHSMLEFIQQDKSSATLIA